MSKPQSSHSSFQSNKHPRWLVHVLAGLVAMMAITSAGCSTLRSLDETAALTYRDFVWAKRAYNLRYGTCDRPYGEHFQNGFCAGYSDVSGGGDGFVPALPPDDYRGYEFQSADGSKCVNAWFEGYPAGVAAARQDKSGSYNDVMISRLIDAAVKQDKTEPTLPGDVSVIEGNQKRAEAAMTVQPQNRPLPISPVSPMPSVVAPIDSSSEPFTMQATPPVIPAQFKISPINEQAEMPMPIGQSEWRQ
ncbi:MAG: hypothetical protein AAFN77_11600 [Planctomycetota bacterium]